MAQHDMILDDADGSTFRADLNNALQAIASTHKGTARPSTIVAGQMWIDQNTPSTDVWTLYLYDGADDIAVCYIDTVNNICTPVLGGVLLLANAGISFTSDPDTILYRSAADTLKAMTGGTDRVRIDSAGLAAIGGFLAVAVAAATLARARLENTVREWSISAYGNDFAPNGGFAIADETGGAVRFVIDTSGNIGLGGVPSAGGGAKVLFIPDGTPPGSNPTGGGILYVESGALKYRGSGGTVTTLAPA